MKKVSAFTLIELLVVIIIIGVLAAISMAGYTGFAERARIMAIVALESQANRALLASSVSNEVGPVGRWDLDEGTGNQTAEAYNGYVQTNNNFTSWWSTDTLEDKGYSFHPGSTQNFRFNINEPLQEEFSVSMRMKFDSIPSGRIFQFFCSSTERIQFQVTGSGSFRLRDRDGSWTNIFTTPWNDFERNKWYHLLVTYSHDKTAMYLDGKLYYELDNPTDITGCFNDDITRFYVYANNGTDKWVDNIKLWRTYFNPE